MTQIDFDQPVQRKGTHSFKWDAVGTFFGREDATPLWVADMDFACAPEIINALEERLRHGVLGYTVRDEHYLSTICAWFKKRHNWDVPPEHLAFAPPGVIFAINILLDLLTQPGDSVVMQLPNYDCLTASVTSGGRFITENPLKLENGRYVIDFDDLEQALRKPRTKVLLLSNPNNPTGRLWTKDELQNLGRLCLQYGVTIISDDIHSDLVMPGNHYTPIPSLSSELAQNTVLLTSTNKSFNLGGLQLATLVIANEVLRERFNQVMLRYQTRLDNVFGAIALETAYKKCDYWLDQVITYIDGNRRSLEAFAAEHLPQLKFYPMEATYFSWIDFSGLMKGNDLERFLVEDCGVALTPGREFATACQDFMRVNLACNRQLLLDAFQKIVDHLS